MPAGPTLDWEGRGRAVVRDPETGRWRFGERAPGATSRLVEVARHGRADAPSLLIHGEAFDALAALRATHRGRVRLIAIDPPFNTGQEFAGYDDRASHAVWLSAIEERVRIARELLVDGGFLVVHINVVEQAYLKVLLDEIFGRERMIAQISWQRAPDRTVLGQGSALVADHVEYLLVYANGAPPADWPRPQRRAPMPARTLETYARTLVPSPEAKLVDAFPDRTGTEVRIFAHTSYALARGADVAAEFARRMRTTNQQPESTFQQELLRRMPRPDTLYRAEYVQSTGKHRGARSRHYLNGNVVLWLRDVAELDPATGAVIRVSDLANFWANDDIPATGIAREGGVTLRRGKKPERLADRLISAFSRPGEWVLDFFAGSGTTGAVAERLGRPFILVEAGPSARDLCEPRLRREIARTGGGFRVMTAASFC